MSLLDLFHALMLPSGNDAACVLAWFFGLLEAQVVSAKKHVPLAAPLRAPSPFDPNIILTIYSNAVNASKGNTNHSHNNINEGESD